MCLCLFVCRMLKICWELKIFGLLRPNIHGRIFRSQFYAPDNFSAIYFTWNEFLCIELLTPFVNLPLNLISTWYNRHLIGYSSPYSWLCVFFFIFWSIYVQKPWKHTECAHDVWTTEHTKSIEKRKENKTIKKAATAIKKREKKMEFAKCHWVETMYRTP